MKHDIPFYISALFIGLTIFLFLMLLVGLRQGLKGAKYSPSKTRNIMAMTFGGLLAWFALTGILSVNDFFLKFDVLPPRFMFMVLPTIALILFLSFTNYMSKPLQYISASGIVGLQSFRILMEIILFLLFQHGIMAVEMTWEGQNFDIIPGLTAPLVAYFCIHKGTWKGAKTVAIVWNIVSILILVFTVATGILSVPTPFQQIFSDPSNTVIAQFPIVWLPAFVVPVAWFLHAMSIKQLLARTSN